MAGSRSRILVARNKATLVEGPSSSPGSTSQFLAADMQIRNSYFLLLCSVLFELPVGLSNEAMAVLDLSYLKF